ncbi:hypothetical protein A3SI_18829 [Nitritalea halalkaliphila LW7]|uniref:GLPGLI family protein n=1 Tax=Nitritalea halalkaliphila LW7 TaxID=1189621 RepID=I5BTT5_9BACT|nr:GLPGLI family protein [Nitritalea halalkaliphila]EIM72987.1 hypothetical protein A3SI_18829 [Nitritalea halalkaliphila LW7]
MKKITFTAALCLILSLVQAQQTLQVTYMTGAPHLNDQDEIFLFISDNLSEFFFPIEARTWVTPQGFQAERYHFYYSMFFKEDGSRHVVRTLEDGTRLNATYTPKPMPWQLTNETKEILGYTCQKAVLPKEHGFADHQMGDVIAWFTPGIEAQLGPNKYTGLPGLILQITYTEWTGHGAIATKIKQVDREISLPEDMGFTV